MWTVKTSSRSAIFSLVFVCLTILTCCSSMPKQIDKEVGRFGHKILRYPVYPPKLENDENAVAKLHREKPHMNTLLKDFPVGYDKRRIRRDIAPSHLKVLQQDEDYEMGNCTENVPSHTPPETLPFTTALPTLNDKDVNITMHCESYWFSCRGRCTHERELGGTEERLQCFCDNSCELFKDCCADFDQFCSSSGTSAKEQNNPDNEQWKCVESDLLAKALGVWMISSCPSNWTQEEVEERCTSESEIISYDNHKDNLPVIDRKGNTYKNHYCAQCHGSNLRELLFYNLQFNCDVPVPNDYQGNQILKSLFSFCSNSNIVYWQPPEGVPRRYCHRISPKQECGTCSFPAMVQQKCLTGSLRLVFLNDTATPHNFFNPYCALIISNAKNIGCGPRGSWPLQEPLPNPFSIVIDLDFSDTHPGKETSKVRKHKVSCCKGNVYDFYLQVCRPGIRPSDLTSLRSQIFSVSVWLRSNISYLDNPLTKLTVKEAIVNKLNIKVTLISDIAIGNHWGPVSTLMFNIKINRTLQSFSAQTLQTAMSSLSIVLNDANFTTFKVVVKTFNCAVIESFNPHEYTFERNAVKITKTGKIFQENDFYTNEAQWINGSLIPIGILTVCKQPRLNCSGILVGLNENEYVILSNGSLYRNISRELFEPRRFKFINDTIWVCANFSSSYETGRSTSENDIVLALLTYIGLSLSIASLVSVLVTYSLFKKLRTLPGINLMNLSLAHLLLDLLFLETAYVGAKVGCAIIAIFLHYFFLVSFTWMSIIAFETWQVFSKINVQQIYPNRRKRRLNLSRRVTLGWLPAFVFIAVCVALDQSNTVAFQYGGVKGCWINNPTANMFFFVLPVALSISFNTAFFVLIVRAIRQTNNQTRRATHQTLNRKTATVFLKIFILMGFTWIFGFLKILVSNYFEYPFIIFTTLQGLYIALAFVFTSRVKKMYRTSLSIVAAYGHKTTLRTKKEFVPPVVLLSYVEKK